MWTIAGRDVARTCRAGIIETTSGIGALATMTSSLLDPTDGTALASSTNDAVARESLALAFRLAERFGFHEGICNHFSVSLGPSSSGATDERYLINPYGIHWSRIQPSSLMIIDGEGNVLDGEGEVEDSARYIHVAAHRANPRHVAIFHTHMPYATSLTLLEGDAGKLAMAHQTACRFHGRIDYEPRFGGLAHGDDEGERLARRTRDRSDIDVLFLANHGVIVSGPSVAVAFDDLYYLERACRQQVLAAHSGGALKLLPDDVVEDTAAQWNRDLPETAERHFGALADVMAASPDRVLTF